MIQRLDISIYRSWSFLFCCCWKQRKIISADFRNTYNFYRLICTAQPTSWKKNPPKHAVSDLFHLNMLEVIMLFVWYLKLPATSPVDFLCSLSRLGAFKWLTVYEMLHANVVFTFLFFRRHVQLYVQSEKANTSKKNGRVSSSKWRKSSSLYPFIFHFKRKQASSSTHLPYSYGR